MSLDIGPDLPERPGLGQEQSQQKPAAAPVDPGLAALQQLTDGAVSQIYGSENAAVAGARLTELGHFDRDQASAVLRDNPEALGPVQDRALATQLAEALPSVYASTDIARPPITAETIERDGVTYAVQGLDRVRDEDGATRLVGRSNEPNVAYVDRERGFPYTFHVRAFHEDTSFYGFSGDNRGFTTSTALGVTSRVQQTIVLDTRDDTLRQTSRSDPTHGLGQTDTAVPESGVITGPNRVVNRGEAVETHTFGTYVQGANPITPAGLTPNIDVDGRFSVTEDLERGILHVDATFKGDNFPNTEAFVTDSRGESVFIAVATRTGTPLSLRGENADNPIMNGSMDIRLDSNGRFTGVSQGGREYTVQQWNNHVTDAPQ